MFRFDDREIRQLEGKLEDVAKRAIPFATRATLNRATSETRKLAQENVREQMVTRNKFSEQSIRVVQERRELNIRRQEAVVGSIADYMEDQEFGAAKTKGGSEGVSIATGYAAGQQGQRPRTRLPRKPNKMRNIQLQRRSKKGSSRKQQNLIAIKQAAEGGRKYVFLDLGRTKGIFKVVGGKRRPKIKMVHDMSRQSVVIPRNPWLVPAVDKVAPRMGEFYAAALRFQLTRLGLS